MSFFMLWRSSIASAKKGNVAAIKSDSRLEEDLWLIPIEDRRSIDSKREEMLSGFTLGNYLMLVEYTGRIVVTQKGTHLNSQ